MMDVRPLHTLLDDIYTLIGNLFLSGCFSVNDSVLSDMKKLGRACRSYGLDYPCHMMERLGELIEMQRHSGQRYDEEICTGLCDLNRYAALCCRQIEIDMAKQNLLMEEK